MTTAGQLAESGQRWDGKVDDDDAADVYAADADADDDYDANADYDVDADDYDDYDANPPLQQLLMRWEKKLTVSSAAERTLSSSSSLSSLSLSISYITRQIPASLEAVKVWVSSDLKLT